jgi:hypothetical protein
VFVPELTSPEGSPEEAQNLKRELGQVSNIYTEVVSAKEALELCQERRCDLVLTGCRVMFVADGGIRTVHDYRFEEILSAGHRLRIPIIIGSGLYKIWPRGFHEVQAHWALNLRNRRGQLSSIVFEPAAGDWLLTEIGCLGPSDFGKAALVRLLLRTEHIGIACAILANRDLNRLDENLIERALSELAEAPTGLRIHPEAVQWWNTGRLPEDIRIAQQCYRELLADARWYAKHKGKYVSVVHHEKETSVESDTDLKSLLARTYEKWGYRPVFTTFVTERPQARVVRTRYVPISP